MSAEGHKPSQYLQTGINGMGIYKQSPKAHPLPAARMLRVKCGIAWLRVHEHMHCAHTLPSSHASCIDARAAIQ